MPLAFHASPGFLIRRLHQISVSIFEQEMAAAGIALTQVQYAALSALAHHDGIDQNTLSGLIAYDRVTIGGVVDRLVTKGLVARTQSTLDRRARKLEITAAGRAEVKRAAPIVERLQARILAGLTAKERAQMLDLLAKTTAANNENSRAPLQTMDD